MIYEVSADREGLDLNDLDLLVLEKLTIEEEVFKKNHAGPNQISDSIFSLNQFLNDSARVSMECDYEETRELTELKVSKMVDEEKKENEAKSKEILEVSPIEIPGANLYQSTIKNERSSTKPSNINHQMNKETVLENKNILSNIANYPKFEDEKTEIEDQNE